MAHFASSAKFQEKCLAPPDQILDPLLSREIELYISLNQIMVSDPKLNVTFSQFKKSFLSAPHLLTKSNNAGNIHNYRKLTNIWIRWKRCRFFPSTHDLFRESKAFAKKTNTNSSTLVSQYPYQPLSFQSLLCQNSIIIKWRRKKTTVFSYSQQNSYNILLRTGNISMFCSYYD